MKIKEALKAMTSAKLQSLLQGLSSWNGEFWDTGVAESLNISVTELFDDPDLDAIESLVIVEIQRRLMDNLL